MSNDKPPMPEQPKTTELPKPDRIEILLQEMRVEMRAGFGELRGDVALVNSDMNIVKERVRVIEKWKIQEEERAARHSDNVRGVSQNDLKQDAAIGTLVADVAGVKADVADIKQNQEAAKTERADTAALVRDVRDAVSTFFSKHPALAAALVGLATTAASAATTWLTLHGGKQ